MEEVRTAIGEVLGDDGVFHYRGRDGVAVARSMAYAEAAALLLDGDPGGAADVAGQLAAARRLPPAVTRLLPSVVGASTSPMAALRTAVSVLGDACRMRPLLDLSPEERRADALRLCGSMPALVASLQRAADGRPPLDPDPDLDTPTDLLRMLTGRAPDPVAAHALGRYLVLVMDHGCNASTLAARVVASTGADAAAAVVAAVGALGGPLHGGAPERALDLLDRLATPADAAGTVREVVSTGGRVMGFGHRLYRAEDPRARFLRELAHEASAPRAPLAAAVEDAVSRVLGELKPGRRVGTNVEFWAGVVMESCGVPRPFFAPTFACGRVVGWCAHLLEQAAEGRLIRPEAVYTGPPVHASPERP